MPVHKLVLLTPQIKTSYLLRARVHGRRAGGYSHYLDLRNEEEALPVRLYIEGMRNGINKLQFDDEIAVLGWPKTLEIVRRICGDIDGIWIYRIDWCRDYDIALLDLALYCQIARARNCNFMNSRTGPTFYLRRSKAFVLYMYDKLRELKAKGDPIAKKCIFDGPLTRIEVQYRGSGVPFRKLTDIKRYADLDMLEDISFWKAGCKRKGLSVSDSLAAEALLIRINDFGLQSALKMFPAQERAYIVKKFLEPAGGQFPHLNNLMRKSALDWLEGRIRFPRLRERSE
jgi:hypothetical protein